MKKIIAFGGSTSEQSINQQLAEHAASLLERTKAQVLNLNDFYPCEMFSTQAELAIDMPEAALRFRKVLHEADGFLVSLAEHNGSYSAAFKNLFDWVSRKGEVWNSKPVLLLGTSPGGRGASSVLAAAQSRFPFNGASEVLGPFSLPNFQDTFSKESGVLLEDKKAELALLIKALEDVVLSQP